MAENRIRTKKKNRRVNLHIVNMAHDDSAAAVKGDPELVGTQDDVALDTAQLEQVTADSAKYISNWHELISRTNWDKGEIICQWRDNVCDLHPEVKDVSDRAWSEIAGGISPEHVGRLRRTYERFGEVYEDYKGLSWTHFMVAGSWSDAEMWLEGASQNGWTIEQMRKTRWESMGAVAGERPDPRDVVVDEISAEQHEGSKAEKPIQQDGDVITGPIIEGPDWGEGETSSSTLDSPDVEAIEKILKKAPDEFADGFRNLSELIKGCHADDWKAIKRRDVLKLLNFLKDQVRNDSVSF